jgi:small subunit ribosomal protein S3
MGQKTNPKIFRIPLIREWEEKWFATGHRFRQFLKEDLQIRKFLSQKLKGAAVDKIIIDRAGNTVKILIYTAKPGLIIGRGGVDVERLKKEIQTKFLSKNETLELNVYETPNPFLSAQIVVESIISDLEKRVPYRRAMKKAIEQVKKAGALGVKVKLGGRLDGVEIARKETLSWGKMPLHTIRADIDYARGTAHTTYGVIGVKVWIYKGEKFEKETEQKELK